MARDARDKLGSLVPPFVSLFEVISDPMRCLCDCRLSSIGNTKVTSPGQVPGRSRNHAEPVKR